MRATNRRGATLVMAALALSGCMFTADECDFKPINSMPGAAGALPLAAITPPIPGAVGGPAVGACGAWVRFNDWQYTDTASSRAWHGELAIADEDLEAIGQASGATDVAGPYADATVYTISGVDRAEAIAMRLAGEGQPVAVLLARSEVPAGLCDYFAGPPPPDATECLADEGGG